MESNKDFSYQRVIQLDDAETASRKYLANVFLWMFGALVISAFCAYEFASNLNLLKLIITPTGFTPLGLVVVFSPLAFSLVMSFGFNRISYPLMVLLFITYAVLIGISLSIFALIYTATSLFTVFLTASGIFAAMSIAGYTTKMDLTGFGSIMYMLFIGILIASLVNFFIGSESLSYIISYIGVAVFTGLTAYYIQMLKRIGEGVEFGDASGKKLIIIGAFVLYTTFINLFLSLLRIFGRRR